MSDKRSFARQLASPDETRTFPHGKLELATFDGVTIGRSTFEPGWKWSACVGPVVGAERCPGRHTGFAIAGRLHVSLADGTELEIGPGEAFVIPPGHDAWVVGDEPVVHIDVAAAGQ